MGRIVGLCWRSAPLTQFSCESWGSLLPPFDMSEIINQRLAPYSACPKRLVGCTRMVRGLCNIQYSICALFYESPPCRLVNLTLNFHWAWAEFMALKSGPGSRKRLSFSIHANFGRKGCAGQSEEPSYLHMSMFQPFC